MTDHPSELPREPERTADGRFIVDPQAMSDLVDWALAQDWPDDPLQIRREAWKPDA
jgi:hypothetical protein